ncbi:RNA polymerase sigma factor RpoD [Mycoplasma haemocanis str. Illinois]|uniref:RNA polymerase sigma factor RpoD n=1 Tax=Mycoplasma haemocanis (strain Illinois) TaxID=1111676 RepID=H6N5F9_MYCHN|nr:sigma-70 family RNA polymerase sigma factor [Mycoplasma haemocanis]AEW44919.1 RNA polymerase sigma factor RpoD [Mycoplasma haemocanis str. Illinois]
MAFSKDQKKIEQLTAKLLEIKGELESEREKLKSFNLAKGFNNFLFETRLQTYDISTDFGLQKVLDPLIKQSSNVKLGKFKLSKESIALALEDYLPIEDKRWKDLALKLANEGISIEELTPEEVKSHKEYQDNLILNERFSNASVPSALKFTRKLTLEEETTLSKLMENPKTRNFAVKQLTISNLRLVQSVAKKYLNYGFPMDDLVQEGFFGLMKAVQKFNYNLGNKFSTYATWWIRQFIVRSIAEKYRIIRVPVHLQGIIKRFNKISMVLMAEKGEPNLQDILTEMQKYYPNFDLEKIANIKQLSKDLLSLDDALDSEEFFPISGSIRDEDVIDAEELSFKAYRIETLNDMLENELNPDEISLVKLRYGFLESGKHSVKEIVEEKLLDPEFCFSTNSKATTLLLNKMLNNKENLSLEEWNNGKSKLERWVRKKLNQSIFKLRHASYNTKYQGLFDLENSTK